MEVSACYVLITSPPLLTVPEFLTCDTPRLAHKVSPWLWWTHLKRWLRNKMTKKAVVHENDANVTWVPLLSGKFTFTNLLRNHRTAKNNDFV